MPRPEWRDPAKKKFWRRLLVRWQRSGQTGREFCAAHQLTESSFYFWKREIAQRDREMPTRLPDAAHRSVSSRAASAARPGFLPMTMDEAGAALDVVLAH